MRLIGLLLFLTSLGGLFLFVTGFAKSGEIVTTGLATIDYLQPFKHLGSEFPGDILLLMSSLFCFLFGLKMLIAPGSARGPNLPPPPDPGDEKAVRKYELQLSTIRPIPRMPTALWLNSYIVITLLVTLFFGARYQAEPFQMGLFGAFLGLSLLMGLVMLFLAKKVEKSLGTGGGFVGLVVHLLAIGVVAAAAVLSRI